MPTLDALAKQVNGKLIGDGNCVIERVATLQGAGAGDISFLDNRKYTKYLKATRADAVIVSERDLQAVPKNAIVVQNPHLSYTIISQLLNPLEEIKTEIADTAHVHKAAVVSEQAYIGEHVVIGAGVIIAEGCYIGAGSVIEQNVTIGADSRLMCKVTILKNCQIGKRALIQPGAVIGSDGFGFANDSGKWLKVPQIGRVLIGDDVEIGANTTIDRGAIEDTIISNGVIIDNLVHIAHNVSIGENTALAACVAIAGSTTMGANCTVGGIAGIAGHLEIADNVHIIGLSKVTQSITEPGTYASGTPVQPVKEWHRNYIRFKKLDELAQKIKKLEQALESKK